MSQTRTANERPRYAPQQRGGGPMGGGHGHGRPVEKAVTFWPSLRRLAAQLRPERLRIIIVVALAALAVGMASIGPMLLGRATDVVFAGAIGRTLPAGQTKQQALDTLRAQGQGKLADMLTRVDLVPGQGIDFAALSQLLLLALAAYLANGLIMWLTGLAINGIVQRSVFRMREGVSQKLNRLPLSYFDAQPRGELLSRVTNDIDNVAQSLQQTLSQILTNLLTVIGVVVMMLLLSPILTAIAVVTIPLALGLVTIIGRRSQRLFRAMWRSTGELNAQIEEAYTGHSLVKVFGRARQVEADFAAKNDEMYRASFGAQFVSGIIMPTMFFVGNLNYVLIAVVGGLWVASGSMRLGDVQAFIQYSRMFTHPITQLASMANLLQSGVASAERVFEVLDAAEELPDSDAVLPAETHGRVEFDHVSFSYDPARPLITDLSLVAEPGATVAIVGPTGAGKTTLVNLILRFYELDGGRITLDGVDVATLPRNVLRSQIGMVLQDTWLFHGTIRDNIAYGRPGATETEIRAAAEATYVDRFVHSLPEGYDTVIDEEGSNVSAGEKQLITIARAFLSDPALLILDEATSSVDTRTELLVQRAMRALREDRTSFVIAHRLSTIRDADTILVMEDGAIVEQGSHAELLARRGAYHRLYEAQFANTLADEDGAA